ncbi:hypothetical protein Bpfe_002481, partial [Biomphalaria pfeifferi]
PCQGVAVFLRVAVVFVATPRIKTDAYKQRQSSSEHELLSSRRSERRVIYKQANLSASALKDKLLVGRKDVSRGCKGGNY